MRAHWEAIADALLASASRFATPGGALLHLPGGRPSRSGSQSDGLEGYARTFLLAAFRLAGAGGVAPGALAERYADGLAAGTTPGHAEAWPAITPYSQPMVEAASIAIALHETRPWLWDALPDAVRQRTADWLTGSVGQPHVPNNWLLFQVVVNEFLASIGARHDPAEIALDLDRIEAMALAGGWSSDGFGRSFDHYVGWALHLYPVLWERIGGAARDPARCARFRARLRAYLADFAHLFGADGAPLLQGRSAIYRFAAAAAPWAGALAGATPLAPGATRRLASGALRYFLAHGAVRDGVLTMGWHDEFLPMAQSYSGPASPYWASKGFLGLLLPSDDPTWTQPEEPLPVETDDFVRALSAPNWLAAGTRADGIVRVYNHGSDHFPLIAAITDAADAPPDDPHYRKLAYSTATAPTIGGEADLRDADAQVALVDADGGGRSRRARIHPIVAADRFAASCFFPREVAVLRGRAFPIWLERVETASIARGASEIRIHHVTSLARRWLRDAGFAVTGRSAPPVVERGPDWCLVRGDGGLVAASIALHGLAGAEPETFDGRSPLGRWASVPVLASPGPIEAEGVVVSLHVLLRDPAFDPEQARRSVASVAIDGRIVRIACADGERLLVQMVAPEALDEPWGDGRLCGPVRFARLSADGSAFVMGAGGGGW